MTRPGEQRAMNGTRYVPDPAALMALVARRYFADGRSKTDIAAELDLNRFKVASLLKEARARGLVRITIGCPGVIDLELSCRVRDAFELTYSVVVRDDGVVPDVARNRVATTVADLLSEIVGPREVLGLSCFPSLPEMSAALRAFTPCTLVQLTGAGGDRSLPSAVRDMARLGGGSCYTFDAPVVTADRAGATARRSRFDVIRAADQFSSITTAVLGINAWRPSASAVYAALDAVDARALRCAGACAEVSGVVLTADGSPMGQVAPRTVGATADQILAVPQRIGVADGDHRGVSAVAAALRSGMVNGLVIRRSTAGALLGESLHTPWTVSPVPAGARLRSR